MKQLDNTRSFCRLGMRAFARFLHTSSGGKITPNIITAINVLAYIPIAWLVADGNFLIAALVHFVFAPLDMVDGELARLTKKANQFGALLDASTDRIKIGLLFSGIAYYLAMSGQPEYAPVPVLAAVVAATVAYVKAKGEVGIALKRPEMSHHEINHVFKEGIIPYDLLNVYIGIGLITGRVLEMSIIVLIMGVITYVWLLRVVALKLASLDV